MSAEMNIVKAQLDRMLDLHSELAKGKGGEDFNTSKNMRLADLIHKLDMMIQVEERLERLEELRISLQKVQLPDSTTASAAKTAETTPEENNSPNESSRLISWSVSSKSTKRADDEKQAIHAFQPFKKGV
jgi:hypothetical protein